MSSTYFLISLIIVIALVFDYTNGFHDAANAIATTVATKALIPRLFASPPGDGAAAGTVDSPCRRTDSPGVLRSF